MNIKRTCSNCKYADYSEKCYSICTNPDSSHCLDYVNFNDTCNAWEKSSKQHNKTINKETYNMMTNYTLRQILTICTQQDNEEIHIIVGISNETIDISINKNDAEIILSDKVLDSRVEFINAADDILEIKIKMSKPSQMPIPQTDTDSFF